MYQLKQPEHIYNFNGSQNSIYFDIKINVYDEKNLPHTTRIPEGISSLNLLVGKLPV